MSWLQRPVQVLSRGTITRHLLSSTRHRPQFRLQLPLHSARFTSTTSQAQTATTPEPPTEDTHEAKNPSSSSASSPDSTTTTTETFLQTSKAYKSLLANPSYTLTRPHLTLPTNLRQNHLVAGPLSGPGKITVPPYVFTSPSDKRVVTFFHAGRHVSGHPGFMQGGLMAVMFDEAFAKAVGLVLRSGVGMTVNMGVDFRSPARLDKGYVMVVWVDRAEGRKVWVRGELKSLAEGEANGQDRVVSEATALFVEPRFAESMVPLYKN